MKKLTLITLLLFTSCSVFKHKTENSSSQKDLMVHTLLENDSIRLAGQSQQVRFLSVDGLELTEIIPEGKFVYQPDSGFRGTAKRLHIYRQTQQRSLDLDTSSLHFSVGSYKKEVDSTLHQQVQQQLEETKESKLVSGWWMYALAAAVLLFVFYVAWKKS